MIYAILSQNPFFVIYAFFSVNFILQKFCPCKRNDKYEVWHKDATSIQCNTNCWIMGMAFRGSGDRERNWGRKKFLKRTSWPHDCKNNFFSQVGEKSFTFKWKITPKGVKVNHYTSKWKKKVKLKRHISPLGEHFYTKGCKCLHFVVYFYTWAT